MTRELAKLKKVPRSRREGAVAADPLLALNQALADHVHATQLAQAELAVLRMEHDKLRGEFLAMGPVDVAPPDGPAGTNDVLLAEVGVLQRALDLQSGVNVEQELQYEDGVQKTSQQLQCTYTRIAELESALRCAVVEAGINSTKMSNQQTAVEARLMRADATVRSLEANVANMMLEHAERPGGKVRKEYGDLRSAASKASRRKMTNMATRQHHEELLKRFKSTGIAANLATRLDGRAAVLVDQSDDGVATGSFDPHHARWVFDDDAMPVMRELRVRDDANISNATSSALAKNVAGVSAHQLKRAKAAFNERLTQPTAEGGYGIAIQESDPMSGDAKSRATVQVSLLSYVTALFEKQLVTVGPAQAPYYAEEEEKRDEELKYLDILVQGDGRNFGKQCSNVQMSFAILNEGRDVARPCKHHTLGIMDMSEDHGTLGYNFKALLDEINSLEGQSFTDPHGDTYTFRMFLSGDWKFLQIVTGMAAPSSKKQFCIWCKCLKEDIADTSMCWCIDRSDQERQQLLGAVEESEAQPEPITLPPSGDARWDRVNEIVGACNLVSVLRPFARDYELGTGKDNKPVVTNHVINMLKVFEVEGQRGDAAAVLAADERIRRMCQYLTDRQAEYRASTKSADATYGYMRQSLVPSIPFTRIVLDVLHCFLRVFDVLFALLVEDACRIGTTCLALLQAEISGSCGVTRFQFNYGDYDADVERRQVDPDARPSRTVTFTEMDGLEKLRVLRSIDLDNVFDAREGVDVEIRRKIWKGFETIYHHLSAWDSELTPEEFKQRCQRWSEDFLTTADIESGHSVDGLHCIASEDGSTLWVAGYHSADFTPYMHALRTHAHEFKRRWGGSLMQFACFALERTNGTQQAMWHSSNNHGGGQAFVGDARQRHHARSVAAYRQLLLQHLRQTFNPSFSPPKYQCAHCAAGYDTVGWCTRHWLLVHAPADLDVAKYNTPALRRPLLHLATGVPV